jgi:hypothetical protein
MRWGVEDKRKAPGDLLNSHRELNKGRGVRPYLPIEQVSCQQVKKKENQINSNNYF